MDLDGYYPRGGKKKSTLSKLAARKGPNIPSTSEESDGSLSFNRPNTASRSESRLRNYDDSASRTYNNYNEMDSDEGIDLNSRQQKRAYKHNYGRNLSDDEELSDTDISSKRHSSKRFHDRSSSNEDISRKHPSIMKSSLVVEGSPRTRYRKETRFEEDMDTRSNDYSARNSASSRASRPSDRAPNFQTSNNTSNRYNNKLTKVVSPLRSDDPIDSRIARARNGVPIFEKDEDEEDISEDDRKFNRSTKNLNKSYKSKNQYSSNHSLDEYDVHNQYKKLLDDDSLPKRFDAKLSHRSLDDIDTRSPKKSYDNFETGSDRGTEYSYKNSRNHDSGSSDFRQSIAQSLKSSILDRSWSSMNKQINATQNSTLNSTTDSCLPTIHNKEAKKGSFLLGSINGTHSMLGVQELERCFPNKKLRVFVGTWNMMEIKDLPDSIGDFLFPDISIKSENDHLNQASDVFILGTQESTPNKKEWSIKIQETLGPHFVLFHCAVFGALYLNVFMKRDLVWYCSVTEESNISTRAGPSSLKTKGAVALSFSFFGTTMLLVNSHFTAHDGKLKERISDYNKISKSLNLPRDVVLSPNVLSEEDVTKRFDCVFWCGDLNFRLNKEYKHVKQAVNGIASREIPSYGHLMEHDQLTVSRVEGLCFQEFQEGKINFKPTYKYDPNSDEFDSSAKLRIPSYTDRILFRSKKKNAITCLHYNIVSSLKHSDHRPVIGIYEVNIRSGKDNIPLAAGMFDRDVWIEGIKRRGNALDLNKLSKSDKNSSICVLQ